MRFTHLAASALAAASLTFVACGGGSSSRGGSAASTAAATSGITQTTTATTTSGTTSAGITSGTSSTAPGGVVSSGPDTEPPLVVLTAPRRGAFTTQASIDVEGTITDQTGVAYFVINGDPVVAGANGAFRHTLPLVHGLNVIEIEAADPLGQRTKSALSVISGDFLPEASVVKDAVATRLNRPAFAAIERVAAQQLGGTNLTQMIMAQNPLYTGGSGSLASIEVNATAASFGTPTLTLDPQTGGLFVRAEIPNVDVTVRAAGRVVGIGYSLTTQVTADNAKLEALAVVNVQNGQVTTDLQNVNVTIDNFRFDISGVPGFLENLARDAVRRLIEDQVEQQVRAIVPAEINKAIAGANGPITQTVMGRQVTLHMIPVAVAFDADGATVVADGDMTMQPAPGVLLPTTPGSLSTPGAAPTHGTSKAFYASVNDDFLNRIGHAAWRGGLMHLKIDDAFLQSQPGMPSWLSLDAYLLQIFFPSLRGQLNPLDPIEIEIGTLTPPVFQAKPAPGLLDAGLGELTFSVYVAPVGGVRQLVLEASLQIQVDVAPVLNQGKVQIRVAGQPLVRTDVSQMPLARFDPLGVENFIDFIIPPVVQIFARVWGGYPLPTHPAINLSGVDFLQDGPGLDFVTIQGDL